ncbi:MAG: hypothetical protein O8C62_02600 [Candidatus Methanoperedens sp.]|nr:hypothetical protein [Candidatus Methanoperedens sp.]
MRKYKAKDEEDLIKQIESDTELDKELEKEELVKGHVVEIRYAGKRTGIKKKESERRLAVA